MTQPNSAIAQQFLEKLGTGAPPAEVASLVSENVSFEIPGDTDAFPWIGARVGRPAFEAFIRDQRELLVPNSFQVDDILESADRAVILGSCLRRSRRTRRSSGPTSRSS